MAAGRDVRDCVWSCRRFGHNGFRPCVYRTQSLPMDFNQGMAVAYFDRLNRPGLSISHDGRLLRAAICGARSPSISSVARTDSKVIRRAHGPCYGYVAVIHSVYRKHIQAAEAQFKAERRVRLKRSGTAIRTKRQFNDRDCIV